MLISNHISSRKPYPQELQQIMNISAAEEGRRWLSTWDKMRRDSSPLWGLPNLARELGVAQIHVKDESIRSPLGSAKALGAPIALVRLLVRRSPNTGMDPQMLLHGKYANQFRDVTVVSATNGNHGRALAAAARDIGCKCVIVLPKNASREHEHAIAAYGARIMRMCGSYDESVEEAARLATENGWEVVSDTSYDGYESIPRDVMQGYGIIAAEALEQLHIDAENPVPFTHAFIQGGAGGFAAGFISYLWETFGADRPKFIIVEPEQSDCLFQSAVNGRPAKATGSVDSVMAGLSCGGASPLAWKFLRESVDHFLTISDDAAITAMRTLACGGTGDIPVVSGESGAAGLAGLLTVRRDRQYALDIGLNSSSRVLILNTEGATSPQNYLDLVGEPADTIAAKQLAHLHHDSA